MRRARLAWAVLGVFCSSSAALADVYYYLPFRMMSSAENPLPYYVDDRATSPGGVAVANAQAATGRAWSQWNAVQCAAPKVVARGLTGSTVLRPGDPDNGFSVTPVFVGSDADPDYARVLSSFVTGITVPTSYSGVLLSCNVFLNANNFRLSTSDVTANNAIDVETVMLHEAGHCLGLDHFDSVTDDPVMSAAIYQSQHKRELTNADVNALCNKNPAAGAIGAPCFSNGTCDVGASCITQNNGPTPVRFCSRGCDLAANEPCAAPLVCTASSLVAGSSAACLLPSNNVTPVGKACQGDGECLSLLGLCQTPLPTSTGREFWVGGYCMQSCEPGKPACPEGSTCTTLGNGLKRCLKSCRPGLADCRTDYACLLGGSGGVCAPVCYTDNDCGGGGKTCRLCDGVCIAPQSATAQLGDLCTQDQQCGTGQTCAVVTDDGSNRAQCTQQCARGCGVCPGGSSCISTQQGLSCLRTCSGPGSCPTGLRCADFPTGKGCVAACTNDAQCLVGQRCAGGECLTPTDAGCTGVLCGGDGGRPLEPSGTDGGVTTAPAKACGCGTNTSDVPSGLFFLGIAILFLMMRHHRSLA